MPTPQPGIHGPKAAPYAGPPPGTVTNGAHKRGDGINRCRKENVRRDSQRGSHLALAPAWCPGCPLSVCAHRQRRNQKRPANDDAWKDDVASAVTS